MIGSLEVTHEIIFTIPSVIQISSINSIRLRFNIGKNSILLIYRDSRTDVNEEELWKTNITEINNCVDLAAKSLGNYCHNISTV